jgi:hypothetical protein
MHFFLFPHKKKMHFCLIFRQKPKALIAYLQNKECIKLKNTTRNRTKWQRRNKCVFAIIVAR